MSQLSATWYANSTATDVFPTPGTPVSTIGLVDLTVLSSMSEWPTNPGTRRGMFHTRCLAPEDVCALTRARAAARPRVFRARHDRAGEITLGHLPSKGGLLGALGRVKEQPGGTDNILTQDEDQPGQAEFRRDLELDLGRGQVRVVAGWRAVSEANQQYVDVGFADMCFTGDQVVAGRVNR